MGIPVLKEISQSDIQCLFFSISFETSDSIIRDEAHILSSVKSAGYEFFFSSSVQWKYVVQDGEA